MVTDESTTCFNQELAFDVDAPTLIEGLPGHGLVAAIAVDLITDQLSLDKYGSITSDEFPPVTTFEAGLVQDLVRVYGGDDPPVLTLESDMALPQHSFDALGNCVLNLSDEFSKAVFLAGAPAENEDLIGDVTAVATSEPVRDELESVGIPIADEPGLVGGITGALVRKCYHGDVPAALLIVRSHPQLPDPKAAKSVIENALEPLVDFDIGTQPLDEQHDEIQRQMQQIAAQYQQMVEEQESGQQQTPAPGMFQ